MVLSSDSVYIVLLRIAVIFLFQAEDGIRDLVRSRGLGDVYKRQPQLIALIPKGVVWSSVTTPSSTTSEWTRYRWGCSCLLYTSDAADERSSVDLGGRRIIKKKTTKNHGIDCSN